MTAKRFNVSCLGPYGCCEKYVDECDDGTQVTLFNGKRRIVIDSGGLGDFPLHGYDVTVLDA